MKNNVDILKRIDFLSSFNEKSLLKIAGLVNEQKYSKGKVIFNDYDTGDGFFIVKKGKISLTNKLVFDENISGELEFFSPLSYFGELSLIDDGPRLATAKAFEDSVLLKIYKEDFLKACREHPELFFSVLKTISNRLRTNNKKYVSKLEEVSKKIKLQGAGWTANSILRDISIPQQIIIITAGVINKIFKNSLEFTEKITEQVQFINEMIHDLKNYSNGELIDLNIEEISPQSFIGKLLKDFDPIAEAANVELESTFQTEKTAKFDPAKIHRVIMDLMRNSVESFHGNPGKIEIIIEVEDDSCHFSITDDGPGIPEQYLETFFEPFEDYHRERGTGLGLAVCKKIINDHNGEIKVKNNPSGGCRFDIYLPQLKLGKLTAQEK